MTQREFCDLYPGLFHTSLTTDIGSFLQQGILSSEDIQRESSAPKEMIQFRRNDCISVAASEDRQFILRDQKPLKEVFFDRALQPGVTREQWLQLLNRHTFFFLDPTELRNLLNARNYRKKARLIIELKTESVISQELARCKVTFFNVGAALFPNATKRGPNSFLPLQSYLDGAFNKPPREFVIEGSLRNLLQHYQSHSILQPGEL